MVVDLGLGDPVAVELLQQLTASSHTRALMAIAARGREPAVSRAEDVDAVIRREEVARLLEPTLRAAVARRQSNPGGGGRATADSSADATGDPGARLDELFRVAARVQHELNNPLAALLAEVQLLSLEPTLAAEHRAAVERMTELVRRVIGIVRRLDEVKGE